MPDLDCLNNDVEKIRTTLGWHTKQIEKLCEQSKKLGVDFAENTLITKLAQADAAKTQKDTTEIIELLKWGKTTRSIILWVAAPVAVIWGLVEWIRHFK